MDRIDQQEILPQSYVDEYGQQFLSNEGKFMNRAYVSPPANLSRSSKKSTSSHQNSVHGSNSVRSNDSQANWVYSGRRVGHNEINSLLLADENMISEVMFSDAIRKLGTDLLDVENKASKNKQLLREQQSMLNELKNQEKNIQQEIDEMVQINDIDRETIIIQTEKLEEAKKSAVKLKKAIKALKHGEKLAFEGILFS